MKLGDPLRVELQDISGRPLLPPRPSGFLRRWYQRLGFLFSAIVVLPTALVSVYYFLVASDVYGSEIKFVVRTPFMGAGPSLSGNLSGLVPAGTLNDRASDAYAINAFLVSRDALSLLGKKISLDSIYNSPRADFLSRYPAPFSNNSSEGAYKFFLQMTDIEFDKNTGISTLRTYAFDPRDAQIIAQTLVELGEDLANRLSSRMREDLVKQADEELRLAREKIDDIQQRIATWRKREQQVDPTKYSDAIVDVIAKLSLEIAQLSAQADETRKTSPGHPGIAVLVNRMASLESQIESEKRSLAGTQNSLAAKISEYEQLQLLRDFSEKSLAVAMSAKETARYDSQKQRIYIERISNAQASDSPSYPYRVLSVVGTLAITILLYTVLMKLVANVRRHAAIRGYLRAEPLN